jgi:rRNA-processing protein CGR1
MVKSLSGIPKSGKPWKVGSKPFNSLDKEQKASLPKKTFEQRMEEKAKLQEVKDFEKQLKDQKAEVKRKKREKTEAKKKLKEKNQFKSSSFQVIKDPKKMKKMTKKLRQQVSTLPPEMFYKLMHGKQLSSSYN